MTTPTPDGWTRGIFPQGGAGSDDDPHAPVLPDDAVAFNVIEYHQETGECLVDYLPRLSDPEA